jgi:hypothetical protein
MLEVQCGMWNGSGCRVKSEVPDPRSKTCLPFSQRVVFGAVQHIYLSCYTAKKRIAVLVELVLQFSLVFLYFRTVIFLRTGNIFLTSSIVYIQAPSEKELMLVSSHFFALGYISVKI